MHPHKRLFINTMAISLLSLLLSLMVSCGAFGSDRRGRLGIGMSNQLNNSLPSISFKLQRSKSISFGGVFGLSSDDNQGGYGAGLKVYRNLFDEPQLNFYAAFLGALIKRKTSASTDDSGFQFDLTLGSEFHFAGLKSLGLSFEFGVSFNKIDDFVIETVGYQFIVAAIHFYL